MVSNNQTSNANTINSQTKTQEIKLGGFPPIIYLEQKNKKIKEFAKTNNQEENISNISKLNILNIKNILGV